MPKSPWVYDGQGTFSRWWREHGQLVRERKQPIRKTILEHNRELQKNPDAVQNLSFAGPALNIPTNDLMNLTKKYPELASPDGEIRTKAWRRFLATAESDPYRIKPRRLARGISKINPA